MAADAAYAGQHVVLATGTASGKSLAYQLPALTSALADPRVARPARRHDALPRADQGAGPGPARRAHRARPRRPGHHPRRRQQPRPARVGPRPRRVRAHQPRHAAPLAAARPRALARPSSSQLRYVVVDECHHYRGVFGAHVAQVLRRLRRICAAVRRAADVRPRLGHRRRARGRGRPAHRSRRARRDRRLLAPRRGVAGDVAAGAAPGSPARTAPRSVALRPPRPPTCSPTSSPRASGPWPSSGHAAAPSRWRSPPRELLAEVDPSLPGAGRGLPRRLPARGAPRARAPAPRRRADRAGGHQRPRARHRHQRPRRRPAGRLPGHARGVLAAGRPGRPRCPATRSGSWSLATTRSTPTSSPIPRPCSASRSRRRCSTRRTPTSSVRTCAPRPPSCR